MRYLKDKGCYYFPEIAQLYQTMKESGIGIDRFEFVFAGAKFDVVFAINRTPFELMFGCVGHGECNFILTLQKGYLLSPITDDVFCSLCDVLHLNYKNDGFSSYKFLQYVAKKVPRKCSGRRIQPHEVARVRKDIPDSKKIYFVRWYPHNRDNKNARNIEKTRKLCGEKAAEFCERNNISSCWSEESADARCYYDPWDTKL
ncbi:DUF6037 family protein [Allofournierella massiliensis]|uniref:DUF6037 family protein n=1 Tax=Allofournierella massiliensis TaxID=1650663 RepID=UPI003566AF13